MQVSYTNSLIEDASNVFKAMHIADIIRWQRNWIDRSCYCCPRELSREVVRADTKALACLGQQLRMSSKIKITVCYPCDYSNPLPLIQMLSGEKVKKCIAVPFSTKQRQILVYINELHKINIHSPTSRKYVYLQISQFPPLS